MKAKKRILALLTAALLFLSGLSFTGKTDVVAGEAATKAVTDVTGVLTYDPGEFEIAEDYAPFVNSALPSGGSRVGKINGTAVSGYNGLSSADVYGTDWLDPTGEMKMRLDSGKTGLLIKSKLTGKDAEGKGVSFSNVMNGDFSMDFRVFSENSLLTGVNGMYPKDVTVDGETSYMASGWFDPDTTDTYEYNPYLDVRRIGIEIASVSDPGKKFTVYVYQGQNYQGADCIARVAIDGEAYTEGGRPGYGLFETGGNVVGAQGWGYATPLKGTTFSNVSVSQAETYSTTIKFDPETMCVYGVSKTYNATKGENGYASYSEEDVLIRNIGTNNTKADNTGSTVGANGLATLSAADFTDGYTTRIFIDSMTADNTELTVAMPADMENESYVNPYYSDAYPVPIAELASNPVQDAWNNPCLAVDSSVKSTYDRYAKMVIYSVNGQSLQKTEAWTVEKSDNVALSFDTVDSINKVAGSGKYDGQTMSANVSWDSAMHLEGESGSVKFTSVSGKAINLLFAVPKIRYLAPGSTISFSIYCDNKSGNTNQVYMRPSTNWVEVDNRPACRNGIANGVWVPVTFTVRSDLPTYDLSKYYIRIQSSAGWDTVSAADTFYISNVKIGNSNDDLAIKSKMTLTSSAMGTAAEGNSFALNAKDYIDSDKAFVIGYAPQSEKRAAADTNVEYSTHLGANQTNQTLFDYASKTNQGGLGNNYYEVDPYSDVREIAITFRSKADPTKAFTVYTMSRTSYNASVGMRVGVEGEAYRNASGQRGYVDGKFYMGGQYASGTWGMYQNLNGDSWNSAFLAATFMKFDPATMCVYSYAVDQTTDDARKTPVEGSSGWILVRDLTKSGNALSTLDASDFEDYTVEMEVTSMNPEWNMGMKNVYTQMMGYAPTRIPGGTYNAESGATGNHILATASQRKCIIDIYAASVTKEQNISGTSLTLPENSGYKVTYEWTDMRSLTGGGVETVTLKAPETVNLFGKTSVENVSYTNEDGTDSGTLTFVNGEAQFTPKKAGVYTFSCGDTAKELKFGYRFTYNDGSGEKTEVITSGKVNMADYAAASEGRTFVGWIIDDGTDLYSSEYTFKMSGDVRAKAQFVDLAMQTGASVRLSQVNPGIRFTAALSKNDYEALQASAKNVSMTYTMTGFDGNKEVTKKAPIAKKNFCEGEDGLYYLYASVVGLNEDQFALKFLGGVTLTYTTVDGKTNTVRSIQPADNWRSISEVAERALADGTANWTDAERKIIESFLPAQQSVLKVENTGITGHVQNVVVSSDRKSLYHSFGKKVIRQNTVTGETEGSVKLYEESDDQPLHGGAIGYYNGYVYVPFIRIMTFSGATKDTQTTPNCYVVRIPEGLFKGDVDCSSETESRAQICYIGAPIVELSSQVYKFEGEEAWIIGGKYGVCNFVDAITFGPKMGGEVDGRTYMTFSLGTTQASNSTYTAASGKTISTAQRGDADNIIFGQFDCTDIDKWAWKDYGTFVANATADGTKLLSLFPADQYTDAFDNMAFFRCGVLDWGPQGICYDSFMDAYLIGTYGLGDDTPGDSTTNHREEDYDGFISLAVDPRSAATVFGIYGNDGETGYVLTAKCGVPSKKNPSIYFYRDKGTWWDTGITSLGNGYYYVKDNVNAYWYDDNGYATSIMCLKRFDLTPETVHTKTDPFVLMK